MAGSYPRGRETKLEDEKPIDVGVLSGVWNDFMQIQQELESIHKYERQLQTRQNETMEQLKKQGVNAMLQTRAREEERVEKRPALEKELNSLMDQEKSKSERRETVGPFRDRNADEQGATEKLSDMVRVTEKPALGQELARLTNTDQLGLGLGLGLDEVIASKSAWASTERLTTGVGSRPQSARRDFTLDNATKSIEGGNFSSQQLKLAIATMDEENSSSNMMTTPEKPKNKFGLTVEIPRKEQRPIIEVKPSVSCQQMTEPAVAVPDTKAKANNDMTTSQGSTAHQGFAIPEDSDVVDGTFYKPAFYAGTESNLAVYEGLSFEEIQEGLHTRNLTVEQLEEYLQSLPRDHRINEMPLAADLRLFRALKHGIPIDPKLRAFAGLLGPPMEISRGIALQKHPESARRVMDLDVLPGDKLVIYEYTNPSWWFAVNDRTGMDGFVTGMAVSLSHIVTPPPAFPPYDY